MASAGLDLLTDEAVWSRFSREARRRAEEEFPAEKMVKRYREIYERTLASESKSKSQVQNPKSKV
jgi:glycosyltransferase involved in cell wall biosynthesis